LREPLLFSELACLFGRARGLFGRAPGLLSGASRFRSAFRLRGALRFERAAGLLLSRARFVLRDACLFLRGLRLLRRGVGLARRVGDGSRLATDVLEELGEDTAERFSGEGAGVRRGLLGRLLGSGSRSATRTAKRGESAAPGRCDLVYETVALLAEPFDLFDHDLPFFASLLEDLLRRVFGSGADLVGGAECARERVANGSVELLVNGDALPRGLKLRLERADSFGELAHTVGERANDVPGRA